MRRSGPSFPVLAKQLRAYALGRRLQDTALAEPACRTTQICRDPSLAKLASSVCPCPRARERGRAPQQPEADQKQQAANPQHPHSLLPPLPCRPSRKTSPVPEGDPASGRSCGASLRSSSLAGLRTLCPCGGIQQCPGSPGQQGGGERGRRARAEEPTPLLRQVISLSPHKISNSLPAHIWGGKQLI